MDNLKKNIDSHIKSEFYPFHMPGHKQNYNFFNEDLNINDVLKFDLTEIPTLDNLSDPKEVLLTLNNKISKIFGSHKSYLTVNGSTLGVICSILCSCNVDDFVLAGRNSHKSLFSGVKLANCNIQYIYPKILDNGIVGGILPCDVEREIIKNNKIKAVFITSPTYEGIVSDIKAISKITNKYNKFLIVDEAHGSHFNLNNYFPISAISNGADIVIQSLHKTLPSLTQTAVIHINKNATKLNILKYINMLQTTSPSYLFMYTVDKLIYDIQNNILNFDDYISNLKYFRKQFNKKIGINKKITLLQPQNFLYDKSKLTFIINSNKSGKDIDDILRTKYKIQIEASGLNYFIALSTVCDSKKGFSLLLNALYEIDKCIKYSSNLNSSFKFVKPKKTIKLNENSYKTKFITIDKCEGKICAEDIIPYPPGIPFLLRGEVINAKHIYVLKEMVSKNINIIGGINNNKLNIIEED